MYNLHASMEESSLPSKYFDSNNGLSSSVIYE